MQKNYFRKFFQVELEAEVMPVNKGFTNDTTDDDKDDDTKNSTLNTSDISLDRNGGGSVSEDCCVSKKNDASSLISILSTTSSKLSTSQNFYSRDKKVECEKKCETGLLTRSFGLLLAFISGVLMTAYSSMIKMLEVMDPMQVVVVRGVLQLVIMGSIARYKNISWRGGSDNTRTSLLLFLVAATGGLRIFFIFTSFSRLPLGDSTTILFSSPVIVMLLSVFILHEGCGVFRLVAAAGQEPFYRTQKSRNYKRPDQLMAILAPQGPQPCQW